jgi:hypothetical protein
MPSPTFTNPHLGLPTEAGWAMGFTWGFLGPAFSSEPPSVIAPDLVDAFNEGVLAGQQVAISGLPIEPACFSLAQETSSAAEGFMGGVHIIEALGVGNTAVGAIRGIVAVAKAVAHGAAEGFVFVLLLLIPGPPPLDPIQEFGRVGDNVRDQLNQLGLGGGSLYVGAGIDESAAGCELLFTPVFTRLDDARQAVTSLGRTQWVIAQWDAAAPVSGGGFAIVESSAG